MLDKKGEKIKRKRWVRYDGLSYRVLYAGFNKLVLSDGRRVKTLKTENHSLKDRIMNIEVITRYDETKQRTVPIRTNAASV